MGCQQETEPTFGSFGVRETAAASLLVIGRLAIAEYFTRRGQDPAIMSEMHGEAVAAWSAAWGCDNAQIESVVSNIHASMCDAPVDSAVLLRAALMSSVVGPSDTSH